MAPEILLGQRYGAEVDMWSLGVTLFAMLGGYFPFGAQEYPRESALQYPRGSALQNPFARTQARTQQHARQTAHAHTDPHTSPHIHKHTQHTYTQTHTRARAQAQTRRTRARTRGQETSRAHASVTFACFESPLCLLRCAAAHELSVPPSVLCFQGLGHEPVATNGLGSP